MPPQPLSTIPAGSNTFIDANIFVNAINGRSAECRLLLERCSREEIIGISSFPVLLETTHIMMIADARQKGHLPATTSKPAKYLGQHPELIASLRDYWTDVQRVLSLNLLFLECEDSILRQAQIERQDAGLLTNDSVIVSFMRLYGIQALATHDADFNSVNGIQVFTPSDI